MASHAELIGGNVEYDEQGDGEPLVMLHGGPVDSRFLDQTSGRCQSGSA
jgi:hypothetical protein